MMRGIVSRIPERIFHALARVAGGIAFTAVCVMSPANAGTTVSSTPIFVEEGNLSYATAAVSISTVNAINTLNCDVSNSGTMVVSGIPAGATIRRATMYWASTQNDSQVTLGGSNVTAQQSWNDSISTLNTFGHRSDVTGVITADGSYTFADLNTDTTLTFNGACLGAASLIVIYETTESDPERLNRIEIFEGFEGIRGAGLASGGPSSTVTLNTDFSYSEIVSATTLSWQGNSTNELPNYTDSLTLNGVSLSGPNNPVNDANNGTGAGGAPLSQYAVDVDTFDVSAIAAGASTVTFTNESSGVDYVIIQGFVLGASGSESSDAPVGSYGLAVHDASTALRMGALIDHEVLPTGYVGDAIAAGDDNRFLDDDDGVSFPTLTQGVTATIPVSVTQVDANDGFLQGWIDWDGDGAFGAGEQIATNVRSGTPGTSTINVSVPVPADAVTTQTFARFRWSTTSGLNSTAAASDGEVEDYILTVDAGAAPGLAPFSCDGTLLQIATRDSTLKELTFTANGNGYSANLVDIASAGENLNAGYGYNEVDNLIYGVKSNSRELYRIDANGVFSLVSVLDNTYEQGAFAGDILPDGTMIYRVRGNAKLLQVIDLSVPTVPQNLGTITLTLPGNLNYADLGLNPVDSNLYGINHTSNRPFYVDVSSALAGPRDANTNTVLAVNEFGPSTFTGGYGATWFDQDGRLYVYDNNTDELSVVNTGIDGNGTGNATLLAVSADDEGGTNDGAYCRGPAPVPLGGISGTVYVDQNGSDVRDGGDTDLGGDILVSLYYDNATPLDTTDDRFIGTTETEVDGTYVFEGLVTIETYRVEVDVNDADLPPGSTIGTSNPLVDVVVTANSTTADQNFGFDPGTADLSITKTANVTSAQAGDTVIWTISVTNAGSGSPSGVKVLDLIPDGFDYVSDDAPATGDIFDVGRGIWFVDEILVGATETLNITTTARDSGEETNYAEIISNSLPDPDSDVDRGRLQDDLDDGIADDDEASFTVSLGVGQTVLSGKVFIDNGVGGATAHDAVLAGGEIGMPGATVSVYDSTDTLLAIPVISGDGRWSHTLLASYSGSVRIEVVPSPGYLTISEQTAGLPSLNNGDPHDGTFTFTPVSGTPYSTLDVGLIEEPRLTQDQSVGIAGGQVALLSHVYTATTDASVTFSYADVVMNPADAFAAALFEDTDCDGAPDTTINAPLAVSAGDSVCIISRVSASSGVGPGAQLSYGITALSAFNVTAKSATVRNDDVVTAGNGGDELVLKKTVRNETKATPEGTSNIGDLGDVLEYRLTMSNPSGQPAINVSVKDQTPAYTSLTAPIPTPITVAPGVTCNLTVPASNIAGYVGPLEWSCPGNFPPGEQGSVTFRVTISP